jgi:hypothetical protein
LGQALFGNDFSTSYYILFGPGRATAAIEEAISGPLKYNAVNQLAKKIGEQYSGKRVWIDAGSLDIMGNPSPMPKMVSIAETNFGTGVARFFSAYAWTKLGLDGLWFADAAWQCKHSMH